MREIEFRAKRLDNNGWVYGAYYKHEPPLQCFGEGDDEKLEHYIIKTGFADWNMPRPLEYHEIDINTLGQYIELKDKMGTKIYEGDIINDEIYGIGVTKYVPTLLSFLLFRRKDYGSGHYKLDGNCGTKRIPSCEVIGNTTDNPELLKNSL